ncbi:MAG: shikimate kinase [Micavibrio aeruginosavorus]|uniref:Shikimate kinase n=1 Tax=Micavibrio aeruginosavorus TaxID=349221 RepID=A0A2W5MT38_9BACT|nr:MAG: shikimate kinase [Micavibrio aeruginosavorus]
MSGEIRIIEANLQKPIVMVGLMGAGKTKIGGLLAEALAIPFIDADAEIEKAAGCTIAEMFDRHGEPAFRDLERKVIARLLSNELKVIAPGGGAMMNAETAKLFEEKALVIWLKADLDTLVERTGRNSKRPLLKNGDPREILQGLMEIRYPVYEHADLTVESSSAEPEVTLQRTIQMLEKHLEKTKV